MKEESRRPKEQPKPISQGGGAQDRALKGGALELGSAQDSEVVVTAAWRSGEREHL
jgi:hypothetical protein